MPRLTRADAFLVVIDVQQKLMPVINDGEGTERNIERLVRGSKIVDIPALLTEQYVQSLGPTVPLIRRAFEETSAYEPIEKSCFSSYGCAEFVTAMRNLHRRQAIVAGV